MKVILPVFYQNEVTRKNDELGIDSDNSEYNCDRTIIYAVIAVTAVREKDDTLTSKVWLPCGDTLCTPLKPKEVEALIDEAYTKGSADGWKSYVEKQKQNEAN